MRRRCSSGGRSNGIWDIFEHCCKAWWPMIREWSDQLSMLPAAERQQVLYEWNDTKTEFPGDKCIHELFEEQVGCTPEAVAVAFADEWMSYGELNRRANQLAHYLRELGVKPDDRVAICVERSLEMIVGVLAVLK